MQSILMNFFAHFRMEISFSARISKYGAFIEISMLSITNLDKLSVLQLEYPKCTPLLAKILEGVLSRGGDGDMISQNAEVIFPLSIPDE